MPKNNLNHTILETWYFDNRGRRARGPIDCPHCHLDTVKASDNQPKTRPEMILICLACNWQAESHTQ